MLDQQNDLPTNEYANPTSPPPDAATAAVDQTELEHLRAGWANVGPGLAKVNELIMAGWIHAEPGENLIEVLLREITMLRAERSQPPIDPDLGPTLVSAFGVMCTQIRTTMHRQEAGIHQIRFDAFAAAAEVFVPVLLSKGRLEGYTLIQLILSADIAEHQRILEQLKQRQPDPGMAGKAMSQAIIDQVTAEIKAKVWMNNMVLQIINGGITPDQALRAAETERAQRAASLNIPPARVLN